MKEWRGGEGLLSREINIIEIILQMLRNFGVGVVERLVTEILEKR